MNLRRLIKSLAREPGHSLVSILGLALGMGFCLLVLAYSRYSWTYDSQVPDADRVYVLKHKRNFELNKPWHDQIPMAIREPASQVRGVEAVTGYTNWFPFTLETPDGLRSARSLTALPGFIELMNIRAVQGNLQETLDRPDAIALTEAAAKKLFGTTHVLGQTVKLRLNAVDTNVAEVQVGAILPTPPDNTTIPYELLNGLNLTILPEWAKDEALLGKFGFQGGYLLVKLAPGASVEKVTADLQVLADNSPLQAQVPDVVRMRVGKDKFAVVKLSPLREAYMDHEVSQNIFSPVIPRGDPRLVAGVTTVGLLLLALAAINYVNLATLRLMRRQREIMLRKVLGVSRGQLAWQYAGESLLVSLFAAGLGLLLAAAALPAFGNLVGRNLAGMASPGNLAVALGIALLTAGLVTLYPAWLALRVRPAQILAGRDAGETAQSKRMRQTVSVAQLSLAMGLAAAALSVSIQTRYAMNQSVGFDTEKQLSVELPIGFSAKYDDRARNFVTELSQQPAIAGVAISNEPAGGSHNRGFNNFQRPGGDVAFLEMKAVSSNFFELLGIAPVAGRLFLSADNEDTTNLVVINEEAARALGFASPALAVGQTLRMLEQNRGMVDQTIVGVAPNVRYASLREEPGPLIYDLFSVGSTLTVRARDTLADADSAILALWPKHFPNAIYPARPVSEVYADNYADDARLARLLALSTLIAMLIAAGGAYVLAADAVRRRTREIALRKLFGAQRRHIGSLVARELGSLLMLAAALGLPLAALVIARYLAPFSEHAPWAYASLMIALGVSAAVVTVAAARHLLLAMRLRPAAALRG